MGNLVGSPLYPKTKGREHHWAVMALPYIGAGLRMAARPFGSWAMKQIPKFQRLKYRPSTYGQRGGWEKIASKNMPKMDAGWKFNPNPVGKYLLGSPEGRLLTGGAGWAGKAGSGIYAAGKGLAKSPLTLGSLVYMGGKWLLPDGTPANENEIAKAKANDGGPPGGGDPGMQGTGEWFAAQAEKEAKIAKQKE